MLLPHHPDGIPRLIHQLHHQPMVPDSVTLERVNPLAVPAAHRRLDMRIGKGFQNASAQDVEPG